eukprot:5964566-Ditylum_brightwellii.AAC.1
MNNDITDILEQIKKQGLKCTVKEYVTSFLGVTDAKQVFTPTEKKFLGKDPDSEPANGHFNYRSVDFGEIRILKTLHQCKAELT